jgi:hypothetical protein
MADILQIKHNKSRDQFQYRELLFRASKANNASISR